MYHSYSKSPITSRSPLVAYSIANHSSVNLGVLILWIWEESSDFLLSISRKMYVVSVRRGFSFLLVLGQAALFYVGLPGPSI